MKNIKKFLAIALALVMAFAMCACGQQAAPAATAAPAAEPAAAGEAATPEENASAAKEDLTFLYIPLSLNNEFFVVLQHGFESKCAELGITSQVQGTQSSVSAEEQLQFVENAIASGIDAIIIAPSSSDGIAPALKKAQEANIPVVTVDSEILKSTLETYQLDTVPLVGADQVALGEALGTYIKEHYPEGTKALLLEGLSGYSTNNDRLEGMYKTMGEDYLDIVAKENADWEVEKGYIATQNMLTAHSDAELVIALCDGMGIGALRAIQEAGLEGKIDIIGVNGDSEALNLIGNDQYVATIAMYPGTIGQMAVELAYKWITEGAVPPAFTDGGIMTVDKSNLDEYLSQVQQFIY